MSISTSVEHFGIKPEHLEWFLLICNVLSSFILYFRVHGPLQYKILLFHLPTRAFLAFLVILAFVAILTMCFEVYNVSILLKLVKRNTASLAHD